MAGEDIVLKARIEAEVDSASLERAKGQLRGLATGPGMGGGSGFRPAGLLPSGIVPPPMRLLPSGVNPPPMPMLPSGTPPQLLLGPGSTGGMGAAAETAAAGLNDLGTSTMDAAKQAAELGKRTRNFYSMMTGNPFQTMGELAKRITGSQGLIDRMDAASFELSGAQRAFGMARRGTEEYAIAEKRLVAATNEMTAATKAAGGTRGKALGVATFGVQNLLTSIGLFGTFQLITVAFQEAAAQVDRLINPVKYLREELNSVAEAAKAAGGGLARTEQLGITGDTPLARMLSNMVVVNSAATAVDELLAAIAAGAKDFSSVGLDSIKRLNEALGIRGYTQMGTAGETYLLRNLQFEANTGRQTTADGYNPYLGTEEDARRSDLVKAQVELIAKENAQKYAIIGYNDEYMAAFQRLTASGLDYAAALNAAAAETGRAIYAEIEAGGARATAEGLRARLVQEGMIAPTTGVEKAQLAVNEAQLRLSKEQERVSRANAASARQSRIESARRGVGQAGVAGAGDTVFDVAQRIIDAQAQLDEAKRNTAYQGQIASYTKAVKTATEALNGEKLLEYTKQSTEALAEILPSLSSEEQAKLKRTLQFDFTGNDKTTKALAELLKNLFDTVYGGGQKPGRDNY